MSAPAPKVTKRSTGGCCDRYCCCSVICIVCFVTVPIILVAIAVAAVMAVGYRSAKIEKYNSHVLHYDNSTFEGLSMSINGVPLKLESVSSFKNYPTGDSCTKSGDPKDGCYNWPSKVYTASVPVDESITKVTLKNENTGAMISELPVRYEDVQYLDKEALMCNDNWACEAECNKRGGTWTRFRCEIRGYLTNGCIRVEKSGSEVTVDKEGKLLSKLMRMLDGEGCDVSNALRVFTRKSTAVSSMTFMVRDYRDPYLMAQDLTFGCPTLDVSTDQCFGITDAETNAAVAAFVVPMAIYVVIVAAVSCGVCALLRAQARKKKIPGGNPSQHNAYPQQQFAPPPGNQQQVYYAQPAYQGQPAYPGQTPY